MTALRAAGSSGVSARAWGSRKGTRAAAVMACALLLLALAQVAASADEPGVPPVSDLSEPLPSIIPTSLDPLKVPDPVDDVVKEITGATRPEPGSSGPGGSGNGIKTGGYQGGAGQPAQGIVGGSGAGQVSIDPAVTTAAVEGRTVRPGFASLATRARDLAGPLGAPIALGVVAVVLLGLASRGPGVISKLQQETESAGGRQVWRL